MEIITDTSLTGIYKITNIKNGKFYVGSARKGFSRRWASHKCELKKGTHKNKHLQRTYNLYGLDIFIFEIIEVVEGDQEILDREQFFIDTLNPHYNLSRNVRQPMLGRKLSPEQIEKMRLINLGRPSWNKGLKFSEEARKRMSNAKKGSKQRNPRKKGYGDLAVIRSDGLKFKNAHEAAKIMGVAPNTITKAITDTSKKRRVKGFKFRYENTEFFEDDPPNPLIHIHQNSGAYVVRGKGKYFGRYKTLEEAIAVRDESFNTTDKLTQFYNCAIIAIYMPILAKRKKK